MLGALVACAALSFSPWSPLPWPVVALLPGRRRWLADELAASLSTLIPRASAPALDAPTRLEAAEALVAGLSRRDVAELLADTNRLRRHLERLRKADFEAGRTRFVDGWLLAESELHVAVLLDRSARS